MAEFLQWYTFQNYYILLLYSPNAQVCKYWVWTNVFKWTIFEQLVGANATMFSLEVNSLSDWYFDFSYQIS